MKFGIVGTNFVSDMFMKGAQEQPDAEVIGVCSGHKENAERFAAKYHIPAVYDGLSEMLADHRVDVVYLAVPNNMHYSMALQCIDAGVHVFVEKPIAPTTSQTQQIFERAEEKGVYVHDGLVPQYMPDFQKLRQSLSTIGTIHQAVFSFGHYSSRFDAYKEGRNPTTFQKRFYNGALMDMGVYCIGDIVSLFGAPSAVNASAALLDTGVDGSAEAVLKYDGFDAVVLVSKASNSYLSCEVDGEDGSIFIESASRLGKISRLDRMSKQTTVISETGMDGFHAQLNDLISSIQSGKKESDLLPHKTSIEIINVLEQCRILSGVTYDCDK